MGRFKLETIMELVNGKQKQLTPVEVIGGALVNNDLGASEEFFRVGAHLQNPTTTSVQINNTVFLYTYANKGKNKKALCFVYNMDEEKQISTNIYRFLRKAQMRRIPEVILVSNDEMIFRACLNVAPELEKYDTKAGVGEDKNKGLYIARVIFGKTKLGDVKR